MINFNDYHRRPKFKAYGLVNAYTDEVVAEFDTRSEAESAHSQRMDWALRVRGVR